MDKKKEKKKSTEDEFFEGLQQFEQDQAVPEPTPGKPVTIIIDDDKLTAFAIVTPPMDTEHPIDKDSVISELTAAGVTFGMDEAAIDELFMYGSFNVKVPVAKGKPPSDGVSSTIEYKFNTDSSAKAKIKEDEHGNVDFRNVSNVDSVEEGTLLAVKIPSRPGEKGMTILGNELPAKDGTDLPLPLGENVEATPDGLGIVAKISGQPILKDKKVVVSPVFEVKGDVSYTTGNINFTGSVIIKGGVQSGFTVDATDDVEIRDNVEKAQITAGGDVRIFGGLYGGDKEGKIKAGGTITIRSVESGVIEAGENIVITQQSRNSILMAGEDIILQNTKGSILGGKATAGRFFDVTNLGSTSFTETIIEVGLNPKIKQIFDDTSKRVTDDKVQLEKIMRSLKTLKEMEKSGQPLPPDKQEMLKKLVPAAHKIKADLDQNVKKMTFMEEKMKSLKAGKCRVKGIAYPGVKLFTLNASMPINKELKFSSFYEQNEQIVVGPY